MNKSLTRIGARMTICSLLLTLTACGGSDGGSGTGDRSVRLTPCAADDSVFADIPFDDWADTYHRWVQQAVDAHMRSLDDVTALPLQCTAESYAELVPASFALRQVAGMVPAYRDAEDLHETDMAAVLLEFLRVYECSMKQREQYLSVYIPRELSPGKTMYLGDFNKEKERQKQVMEDEMRVSRLALERTLGLVAGYDRLRPLNIDIECIKRASLDMRNVLGLAADASACLPRVWDARGSLRDLPDEQPAGQ